MPIKLIFAVLICSNLLVVGQARADLVAPGVAAGFNYSTVRASNYTTLNNFGVATKGTATLYGLGFAGALTIGLLQDSILGFEAAEDYLSIGTGSGNNTFGGKLAITNATAHFMFHLQRHYHELGIGYAYARFLSSNSTPSASISKTMQGLAFSGKDYLAKDKKNGPFFTARAFLFSPGGTYSPLVDLSILFGFDF